MENEKEILDETTKATEEPDKAKEESVVENQEQSEVADAENVSDAEDKKDGKKIFKTKEKCKIRLFLLT